MIQSGAGVPPAPLLRKGDSAGGTPGTTLVYGPDASEVSVGGFPDALIDKPPLPIRAIRVICGLFNVDPLCLRLCLRRRVQTGPDHPAEFVGAVRFSKESAATNNTRSEFARIPLFPFPWSCWYSPP